MVKLATPTAPPEVGENLRSPRSDKITPRPTLPPCSCGGEFHENCSSLMQTMLKGRYTFSLSNMILSLEK